PDVQVLQVLDLVRGGVGDRSLVQHPDELGEGLRVAVVWCGRGQDQGVGTAGEQSCEGVVAGAAVDQVVGFVDDDGVPVRAVQVMCVDVALERVHGDDRAL